jgi:hypothetical protein
VRPSPELCQTRASEVLRRVAAVHGEPPRSPLPADMPICLAGFPAPASRNATPRSTSTGTPRAAVSRSVAGHCTTVSGPACRI